MTWVLSHEDYPEIFSRSTTSALTTRRWRDFRNRLEIYFKKSQADFERGEWRSFKELVFYFTATQLLFIVMKEFSLRTVNGHKKLPWRDPFTERAIKNARHYRGGTSPIRKKRPKHLQV